MHPGARAARGGGNICVIGRRLLECQTDLPPRTSPSRRSRRDTTSALPFQRCPPGAAERAATMIDKEFSPNVRFPRTSLTWMTLAARLSLQDTADAGSPETFTRHVDRTRTTRHGPRCLAPDSEKELHASSPLRPKRHAPSSTRTHPISERAAPWRRWLTWKSSRREKPSVQVRRTEPHTFGRCPITFRGFRRGASDAPDEPCTARPSPPSDPPKKPKRRASVERT